MEHKESWDNFVSKAKNATFLFYRDFMEYHQDRFIDHSLLVFKNKKIVAIFPANKVGNCIHSHQGLSYGGLLVSENLKFDTFKSCLDQVLRYYKKDGFSKLRLKQLPSIYNVVPNDELNYIMFVLQATLYRRDALSVLNLKHKPKPSRDRLAGYKRGVRENLMIKEVSDFDAFWNGILIPNLNFKHQVRPVHSLDEIRLLKNRFPNNIRQFNVYKDDRLVAGTTIFETKNVAHSQYISGDQSKNTLGSLDFLHMHLIDQVFKDKQYFDFGISNENEGKQINKGLNYWKEGFGARTVTQDFYEIDLTKSHNLNSVLI